MLLLVGITLGVLFNPVTGPQTRKWISDRVFGGRTTSSRIRATATRPPETRPRPSRRDPNVPLRAPSSSGGGVKARVTAPSPSASTGATNARAIEPGRRPLAVEMSDTWSTIAPGFGAVASAFGSGAQPDPSGKTMSERRRHAIRYGYGETTPS